MQNLFSITEHSNNQGLDNQNSHVLKLNDINYVTGSMKIGHTGTQSLA